MGTETPNPKPEGPKKDRFTEWLKSVLPKEERTPMEKDIGIAKYEAIASRWKTEKPKKPAEKPKIKIDEEKAVAHKAEAAKMIDEAQKQGGMSPEAEEAMYSEIGGEPYKKILAKREEIPKTWKEKLAREARAEAEKMTPKELEKWNKLRAEIEEKHGAEISILMHPNESIKDVVRQHVISLGIKKEEHGRGRFGEKGEWIGTPAGEEAMAELIFQENPALITFDMHQVDTSQEPATARILLYDPKQDEFKLIGGEHGEDLLAQAPKEVEDTPHQLLVDYDSAVKKGRTVLYPEEIKTELTKEEAHFPEESEEAARGYALHGGEILFKGGKSGTIEQKTTLGGMKANLDLKDRFILQHDGKEVVAVWNPKKGEYFNAVNPRQRVQVFHGDKIKPYHDMLDFGYAFGDDGTIHFGSQKAEREITLIDIKEKFAKMPETFTVVHNGEEITTHYDKDKKAYVDILGDKVKIHDGDKIAEYQKDWIDYAKLANESYGKIA